MGKVFISYRRDDAAGYARAIYEELTERFPPERVFMDVDAIEPGLPFDEVIRNAVGQCEALLVLIGARWLAPGADGRSRLEDERDFVRLEIAAALTRKIRVIPVLLDGTPMPKEGELPEPLRGLVWRNAIEVSNTRFNADVSRLAEVLARIIGDTLQANTPPGQAQAVEVAPSAPVTASPMVSASAAGSVPPHEPAATAPVQPPQAGRGGRTLLVAGLAAVCAAVAVFSLWPERGPTVPSSPDVATPAAQPAQAAIVLPEYGVVLGSDRTLEAARDEIRRAGRNGVQGAKIYFRNGYFASIAPAATQAEVDRILVIVRAFRHDAYGARMATWCVRPRVADGYIECPGTGAAD